MTFNKKYFVLLAVTCIWCGSFPSSATIKSGCTSKELDEMKTNENFIASQRPFVIEITNKLETLFNDQKADVVLLANVGQNVSTENFENPKQFYDTNSHKYMHSGIAYRDPQTHTWKVIHLLNNRNECGAINSKSYISNDSLKSFFKNSHYKMDILVKIPSVELQKKLLALIPEASKLHNENYSAIANPFSLMRQNSNQFILYLLSSTQIDTPVCQEALNFQSNKIKLSQINSNLRTQLEAQICAFALGYSPSEIISKSYKALALTLYPHYKPNVNLIDHPYESQLNNHYKFASAASVFRFLEDIDHNSFEAVEVCSKLGCDITRAAILANQLTTKEPNEENQ